MTAGPTALSHKDMGGLKVTNMDDGTDPADAVNKDQLDTVYTNAISRANHTGTQLASTISNFDTQVRTNRLDQMAAPTSPVPFNNQQATGLADPSSAQDAATKNYVDTQLAGVASGLVLKGSVRATATTNINIASAPATIDGITPSNGDIFLLIGQTAPEENGPRVWTAAGAAMARAANWNTSGEAVLGSFWDVREGTNADTFALLTNDTAITLDTTGLTFVIRGATGAATGYTQTLGTITAGGSQVITHGLGSRAVIAMVARTASPYDFVDIRIERTSTTTVTVLPDVNITSGDYEIMISRVI